jgi:hypothetical protein
VPSRSPFVLPAIEDTSTARPGAGPRVAWLACGRPADATYAVNGERRSFSLLRPIADATAQERVRDLVLQAYAEYEETATEAAS